MLGSWKGKKPDSRRPAELLNSRSDSISQNDKKFDIAETIDIIV
jgi:hypothetical protein